MRYDGRNLKEVLARHAEFLKSKSPLMSAYQADFSDMCLRDEDFSGLNLSHAIFHNAEILGCNFNNATLVNSDFSNAIFRYCSCNNADFSNSGFAYTVLEDSLFNNANFHNSGMPGAVFIGLQSLINAVNLPYIPMTCPEKGGFIGWKKCYINSDTWLYMSSETKPVIVKLYIPADAKRSSSGGRRKCRANKAKVLGIYSVTGEKLTNAIAYSGYDCNFAYEVGKTVVPSDEFCENRWNECASGIHFFMQRQEAIDY